MLEGQKSSMPFGKRDSNSNQGEKYAVPNERGKEQLGVNEKHQGADHTMQEMSRKMTFLSAGTNRPCHAQHCIRFSNLAL